MAASTLPARLGALLLFGLLGLLAACDDGPPSGRTLAILSGSENRSVEPIVAEFCADHGWSCPLTYQGSVDIKLALEAGDFGHDAVWPAHSRWIDLGDIARRVRHVRSIMQSPVVLGVARSRAERLGLADGAASMAELADLVRRGELRFLMTSATQSNSGFSFYLAMMSAFAGSPEVLTADHLADPQAAADVSTLLGGVERSAGSSDWLKDLFIAGEGAYGAMVNYEALLIEANRALESAGREPLLAVYPTDGVAFADSPLGFVPLGDEVAEKEAFFLELQAFLLSAPVQQRLLALGRRTGYGGVIDGADPAVFRRDWNIDPTRVLTALRFPDAAVIEQALALYQGVLRKPSLLALCLDFSGSMDGEGAIQLKAAITGLFDPESSRRTLLQATDRDVFIAIPFAGSPREAMEARGPRQAVALATEISRLRPAGGTQMYACARAAIETLRGRPEMRSHVPAVVLLTDGRSDGSIEDFARWYRSVGLDIPVYGITFGDADASQLDRIAELTRARVFDGRGDLAAAFRQARGYN